MKPTTDNLFIDLDDIVVDEVIVLSEEGSRAIPEFAASCLDYCTGPYSCSCAYEIGIDSD
ncbi:MAG: hypothetical protein AAGD01_18090 [Acidobacteriota bacterium]